MYSLYHCASFKIMALFCFKLVWTYNSIIDVIYKGAHRNFSRGVKIICKPSFFPIVLSYPGGVFS